MIAKKFLPAVLILALAPALAAAAPETGWFDLENCDMCSAMTVEEGLLEAIDWENHVIATGMMSVTRVPDEYAEAWGRAMGRMGEVQKKLATGGEVHLCNFCQSMGKIMQSGASVDNLQTGSGQVMVVSSRDAATIDMIHVHAKRTIDEHAKMMEGMEGHDHAGHSH